MLVDWENKRITFLELKKHDKLKLSKFWLNPPWLSTLRITCTYPIWYDCIFSLNCIKWWKFLRVGGTSELRRAEYRPRSVVGVDEPLSIFASCLRLSSLALCHAGMQATSYLWLGYALSSLIYDFWHEISV